MYKLIAGVVGFILFVIVLLMSIYTVPAGNVGVMTHWGAVQYVVYPGLGFKAPIADGVVRMNIQTQKDEVDASSASKDLQLVTAKIAVNYHLDPAYAKDIYQNIGTEYQSVIIAPAIQNVFKSTTAKFTAEELITKREAARVEAENGLVEQLKPYHILVDNFNIVNFDFSPEFNAAIEAKQVAQQSVETSKQKLAQAQVEAQTALAVAEGQAKSQAALKDAGSLTPEYLEYVALQKWNGVLPNVTGSVTPFIDVSKFANTTVSPVTK
jgi:regulator of protease activity HflC (stomatin/prohibitin superfamily)